LTSLAAALCGLFVLPSPANAAVDGGGWSVICKYVKSLPDDPIIYPGQPGASHLHDFFGSYDTDAYSTPESLLASSRTSCKPKIDESGYWFPSLVMNGNPVAPTSSAFYYRGPDKQYDASLVRPIPAGLVMIAGDSRATVAQPSLTTYWQCGPDASYESPKSAVPYDCSPWPGNTLRAILTFPSCWDGVNLDSPDHKSHMAYPLVWGSTYCPLTHPVMLVRLTAVVAYETVTNGAGATLSSGSPYSFHGDFMNGWDQASMVYLTQKCVQRETWCRFQNMAPPPVESSSSGTDGETRGAAVVTGSNASGVAAGSHAGLLCRVRTVRDGTETATYAVA
jgi:hypothetical protein